VKKKFYYIKLTFTVFHILNRKLPQGREGGRSSHKKQSLITTIKEFFSNIPREATKMACSRFRPRLEKVVAAKGDLIC
jgi:hypothetical protein